MTRSVPEARAGSESWDLCSSSVTHFPSISLDKQCSSRGYVVYLCAAEAPYTLNPLGTTVNLKTAARMPPRTTTHTEYGSALSRYGFATVPRIATSTGE